MEWGCLWDQSAPRVSPETIFPLTPPSPRSYGVLELDGEKRLSGPGLPSQHPLSVMVSGGPWPGR